MNVYSVVDQSSGPVAELDNAMCGHHSFYSSHPVLDDVVRMVDGQPVPQRSNERCDMLTYRSL